MKKAILVTSIGAKLPLLRVLKCARDSFDATVRIIGADINADAPARGSVEGFWQMPPLESLGLAGVLAYARSHNVGYIIPTRDAELPFFAKHKATFRDEGIAVFVANETATLFCCDKLRFFEDDTTSWAIPTHTEPNAVHGERLIAKERFGAGAQTMLLNATHKEAKVFAKKLQDPIFQPFIEGKEYSIDCYVDKEMRCRATVVRSRDVVIDGESQVSTIVHNEVLAKRAAAFVEQHKIEGHSVLQVQVNAAGSHLIECNARFGGASTLSEYVGLKSFLWFLYEANGVAFDIELSPKIIRQTRENKEDSYSEY